MDVAMVPIGRNRLFIDGVFGVSDFDFWIFRPGNLLSRSRHQTMSAGRRSGLSRYLRQHRQGVVFTPDGWRTHAAQR